MTRHGPRPVDHAAVFGFVFPSLRSTRPLVPACFREGTPLQLQNADCNKTQALKIRTEAAASYPTLRERSFVRVQLMAFQQSNRVANRYVNPVRPVCQFIPDLIEGFFV